MKYREDNDRIMVIGHKNPDTDSICSAIAYAHLMNKVREERINNGEAPESIKAYEPCRAGVISPETSFVLDRFHFPIPRLCLDVKAQVSDLNIREEHGILPDISLREAWEQMKNKELQTLPVVDETGSLTGVISVKDIAMANMDILDSNALINANVPIGNILSTISGELLNGDPEGRINKGRITIGASRPEAMEGNFLKDDIVILGNRSEMMLRAIELGASAVIVCMCDRVPGQVIELAKDNDCILIRTLNDTYTTSRKLNQSIPVGNYMKTEDVMCFEPSSLLDDVRELMSSVRYDYFPVVEEKKVIGLISKRNFICLKKKQLVLVDHNEKSQCVDGYEEAEILAIIDHHRIGDIETTGPIIFRNVPVGCTATIITDMYHENRIEITPEIAGILCCAILSDTLAFTSPTCTAKDEQTAKELACIAGVDYRQLSSDMFDAGEDLTGKTSEAIFKNDYKILRSNGLRIAIAQGTFNSPGNLHKAENKMNAYINEVLSGEKVDLAFYIATSIPSKSSDVIYAGDNAEQILKKGFHCEESDFGLRISGLVSRKKQFVPALINALS
ncbi:MAG: putative manganese-dependent inorganic diphosphatase [Eubacteriales bacterium]|nr:putative manganese-dependent inorganic diphosphatase [Eubacteriales bacterium]